MTLFDGKQMKGEHMLRKWMNKLYGGLNMSWPAVVLFAAGTAVLTAVFLIFPIFKDTSFERMGVTFEAWIFFAIIIMANCKKPLESAVKTFVFFLISQPLIYLIQVPFSSMGWKLFGYYGYWFKWTLCTFPMAFVGWYIKKKNWLSLLILSPILFILTNDCIGCFREAFERFPHLIVTAVFCLGQVLIYLYVFTENIWQKLAGLLVPVVIVVVLLFIQPQVEINGLQFLPDDQVLTENAEVEVDDPEIVIEIAETGQDSMIRIQAKKFCTTSFVIKDGQNVYQYTLEIYKNDKGNSQVKITPAE